MALPPMIKIFSAASDEEVQGYPILSVLQREHGRFTSPLLKMASSRKFISKDVRDYIDGMDHPADEVAIFISALGSDEAWGANKRGDAWPESGLSHKGPVYGFETYKHGHTFLHHKNDSVAKAVGRVKLASWNPRMKRVELVKTIKRASAPEICARIDRGEMIETSMGARVPYDICSKCAHRAKVSKDHCVHIKEALHAVMGNGERIRMINDQPGFFDSSVVRIKAAQEAGQLLRLGPDVKVAHDSSAYAVVELFGVDVVGYVIKEAEDKDAYLNKKIDGQAIDTDKLQDPVAFKERLDLAAEIVEFAPDAVTLRSLEPTLSKEVLKEAALQPEIRLASTFIALGMEVHPEEHQYMMLRKAGWVNEAEYLYDQNLLLPGPEPDVTGITHPLRVSERHVDQKLAEALRPWLQNRSMLEPHLTNRIEWIGDQDEYKIAAMMNRTMVAPSHQEKRDPSMAKMLLALALGYGLYRKMAPPGERLSTIERSMRRHPWMIPLVFVSGALGTKMIGDSISKPHQDVKVGGVFWNYVAPMGGAYVLSASARRKGMEGYPLSSVERVVRDYPLPAGLAGVIGARKLSRPISKIRAGVQRALKAAHKEAGVAGEAGIATALGWYSPYQYPMAALDFWAMKKLFGGKQVTSAKSGVSSGAVPPAA